MINQSIPHQHYFIWFLLSYNCWDCCTCTSISAKETASIWFVGQCIVTHILIKLRKLCWTIDWIARCTTKSYQPWSHLSGGMFRGMALARWLKETKSIRRPPISVPLEKEMLFQVPVRKDTNMDWITPRRGYLAGKTCHFMDLPWLFTDSNAS